MEQFKLSEHTDKNKIFIINRSEIEGRMDPYFYKEEFNKLRTFFDKNEFIKIGDVLISWNRGDGPRNGFYTEAEDGVYFLRVNNLKNNSIDLTDVKLINRNIHEKNLKRTQVKGGDLIFAISGTKDNLGTVSIIPNSIKEANLNSALVRLDLDRDRILNEFFCILFDLKFVRVQIDFIGKGAAQNNLNNSEIKSIRIPNISIEFQKKIISLMNEKKVLAKQKEAEAQRLLDSIDDYLLGELGIVLPNEEDMKMIEPNHRYNYALNTENPLVKNGRLFLTSVKEVSGGRIDPDYIIKSKLFTKNFGDYPFVSLKNLLVKPPQYGANEEAQNIENKNYTRYIRITDIDEIGNLKSENKKTASIIEEKYILNYNDLLFARSGSVGKCYIHKNMSEPAIFAGYLIRFVVDTEKCNPDFLFYYCNSKLYKYWVSAIERPAVQSNINAEEYKALPIPLPPLERQQEIADNIQKMRMKALQLQTEANQILEQTKQQIEQMILGS